MIIESVALIIGFGSFGALLSIGICLSAWKGEFNPKHNICSVNNCCNPDHWDLQEKAKLLPEHYKTMKDNIERFKKVAEAWN